MELLKSLVEGVQKQGEVAVCKAEEGKDVNIMKVIEDDDIEAYLTTFERLMVAYEVKKERWAFRFAPQLAASVCWNECSRCWRLREVESSYLMVIRHNRGELPSAI